MSGEEMARAVQRFMEQRGVSREAAINAVAAAEAQRLEQKQAAERAPTDHEIDRFAAELGKTPEQVRQWMNERASRTATTRANDRDTTVVSGGAYVVPLWGTP